VDFRPTSNVEVSFGTGYNRTFGARRWVENVDGDAGTESIFASLYKDQISPSISASLMVHRNLSIQLSGQAFIAGLDYQHPQTYLGGNNYADRDDIPEEYYDYNYSAMNSSLIMRWEYRPGSTMYLVWTRSRPEIDDTANNLDLSRDLNRLFSSGSRNIFLIKASYWWNL